MKRTKPLTDINTLYSETISKYPIEERLKLFTLLGNGIKNEAEADKQRGALADKILQTVNGGK